MNPFDTELGRRLSALREANLLRELHRTDPASGARVMVDGRELLCFSSNDYLGLASHPALKDAAVEALEEFGTGSGAARLISGSSSPHHALDEALAQWKQTEAALAFSTGFAAALGTIPALVGPDDVVILDKRVHASCVDAARLSRAQLRIYRHCDTDDLERKLRWARRAIESGGSSGQILIVTESVFSMDGDLAPLREIVELKDRYGAWLMVDEAHATGLFGERRTGLAESFEVADRVEVQLGTLGKALGVAGGFIAGSRRLIDLLVNRARSFVFSTAPMPAQAAAAHAAIRLIQSPEGEARRQKLWARVDLMKNALIHSGWPLGPVRSAIIPLIIGEEAKTMERSAALRSAGFLVPAIRYPTVARKTARLRVTVTAAHEATAITEFAAVLGGPVSPGAGPESES